MRPTFRYWRFRLLGTTFLGYAVYYFLRLNLNVAMPVMLSDLKLTKADGGFLKTCLDMSYGLSKLVNGILADRTNPRYFMALGLLGSVLVSVFFGLSSGFVALALFWTLNGWFQGIGFPPVARILSHWFGAKERGLSWGAFNTSHQVGAALILVLAGWLVEHHGWRAAFFGPALLGALMAVYLAWRLADTPASLGLPPVEVYLGEVRPDESDDPEREGAGQGDDSEREGPGQGPQQSLPADYPPGTGLIPARPRPQEAPSPRYRGLERELTPEEHRAFVKRHVFLNPWVWVISLANFFVYVVRYGVLTWAPTYLHEVKHVQLTGAGGVTAAFELAGLVGSLLAGYLTDRLGGRRAPICVLYMGLCSLFMFIFWKLPAASIGTDALLFAGMGFMVYGPQFLVGIMMADLATKRAAASAIGLSGFFGYMSGWVSGWGMGTVAYRYGWDAGFGMLFGCAAVSMLLFATCWGIRPLQVAEDDPGAVH